MKTKEIITRFPPSPTGFMTVGNARTALINYLFAKQNGGKFLVRIEDTDKERSKKEYEDGIFEDLEWLGLEHDNKGNEWRQTHRSDVYKKYLEKMIADGHAYVSDETETSKLSTRGAKSANLAPRVPRVSVIRFKNPNKEISFSDLIRGEITFDTTELGDFVIAKSADEPLYHLAVVVDDHESNISHIIRGDDGISNTPRQILIQEAIGAERPIYVHLPLVLDTNKTKLSKRKEGVSIKEMREAGYIPEAVINHMALLGWHPKDDKETFTLKELIEVFDITKVQKGGAVHGDEKLRWINKEHLKEKDLDYTSHKIKKWFDKSEIIKANCWSFTGDMVKALSGVIVERIEVWSDLEEMLSDGELGWAFDAPKVDEEKLRWKDAPLDEAKEHLSHVSKTLGDVPEGHFTAEKLKEALWPYAEEKGKGNVLWPMRYALSGRDKSPDPFVLAGILGKEETLKRLSK